MTETRRDDFPPSEAVAVITVSLRTDALRGR